jgi:UDP-glucose 4-epimerase
VRFFVIGGAGFIGSHLVDLLVERGHVTIYDNLTLGKAEVLERALATGKAHLATGDVLDQGHLVKAMAGHDVVFHLSANPEARWGLERTRLDLEQGTIAAHNALEAARLNGVSRFVFTSSWTVYGNKQEPCEEKDLGHLPISLSGASKLAAEALIASYVECFGLTGFILRLGNVVGSRSSHGALVDFCRKLKAHPEYLDVLGDGHQAKPYLHVSECVAGLLYALDHAPDRLNVFNLAPADTVTIRRIAELCVAASPHKSARIEYQGGEPNQQAWPGDVLRSRLLPHKLAALGFKVRLTSEQAVERGATEVAREVFGG